MKLPNSYAVIGAGLIGLCTALELLHRGCRVTLVEQDSPGKGASFGNAGFIASELIDPLATGQNIRNAWSMLRDPQGALALPIKNLSQSLPWMIRFALSARPNAVEAGRESLARLLQPAVPAWKNLLGREGLGQHLHQTHYMRVWEKSEGVGAARAEQAFYNDWGIPAHFADSEQVANVEPALRGRVHHAVLLPDAHRVGDPYTLSQALLKRFIEHGGVLLQEQVLSLRPLGSQVELVTNRAAHTFSKAIVCGGAHSSGLLKTLGIRVPLMAERGYHLNLAKVHGVINGPICSAERNVFISPLEGGLRIVGFSELGGVHLPANPARYAILRHHLGALLPQTQPYLEQAGEWMGMRPTLPDSLPVIDTHPDCPQIGFAFGHQHAGLTLAAVTGQLISDRMTGGVDSIDLRAYGITRF
ncbi:NAD(P)/FAD-dependent oxidoreductase [Pseudomonas saxonica]|uniref:FAD-binding oxidoreductase n=1 Tax=Pseudomonas saxonica TaxID=2600598 RepID=A0A5C5Q067_9PSED|nr:FAD-binding oxidoreductase [Pseudomonas saxonica]TWR96640.1 FAD-binding oxidoreductase [Pseudomonas saxonica]